MTAIALNLQDRRPWLVWLLLLVLVVAINAIPDLVSLPEPDAKYAIETVTFAAEGEEPQDISLPHVSADVSTDNPVVGTYWIRFDSRILPDGPVSLFIPAVRHNVEISVNGERVLLAADTTWTSSLNGFSVISRVPEAAIRDGENEIVVRESRGAAWLPGYLSRVYLGPDDALVPAYRLRGFIIEQSRIMTLALHVVVTLGILSLLTTRRHDAVFRWLALVAVTSLFVVVTQSPLTAQYGRPLQLHFAVAMSSVGLMSLGLALAIVGRRPPRLLLALIVGLPACLLALALARVLPLPAVGLISSGSALAAYAAATGVLAAELAVRRNFDAAMLAVPYALTALFGLHDVLMVVGLNEDAFMRTPFARTLMLAAIMVILMARLARSLNEVDEANETLKARLAAQEAELVLLHEKERMRTGELVREHERQRLMTDLHDGLSGHLVSIIALSETAGTDPKQIELSAREALEDLRLVVQSLDIGDRDLLVALASFRERLGPQLRRLGVTLEWSTDATPEIEGLTPGSALAVLRIMQEAVTNALKHGPARKIAVRITQDGSGAVIIIDNDGRAPTVAGTGRGLANMRRRAEAIGGSVSLDLHDQGARLVLHLPRRLREADG